MFGWANDIDKDIVGKSLDYGGVDISVVEYSVAKQLAWKLKL